MAEGKHGAGDHGGGARAKRGERVLRAALCLLHRLGDEAAADPGRVDDQGERSGERAEPDGDHAEHRPDQIRNGSEERHEAARGEPHDRVRREMTCREDGERYRHEDADRGSGDRHLERLGQGVEHRSDPLEARREQAGCETAHLRQTLDEGRGREPDTSERDHHEAQSQHPGEEGERPGPLEPRRQGGARLRQRSAPAQGEGLGGRAPRARSAPHASRSRGRHSLPHAPCCGW